MTLPDEKQRELFEWCDSLRGEGLRQILLRMEEERGIKVSLGTLSRWLNWYSMKSKLTGVSEMADTVARILKETPGLDLDDSKIMRAAQAFFEARAMEEGDAKTYVQLAAVRRGAAELAIKERRVSLEEEKLAQAKSKLEEVISKGGISAETMAHLEEVAKIL